MEEEKIKFIENAKKRVFENVLSNNITKEEYNIYINLIEDDNVGLIIHSISKYNQLQKQILKKILSNKEYQKALVKVANSLYRIDEYVGEEIFELFNDNEFPKFINLLSNDVLGPCEISYNIKNKFKKVKKIKNWDLSRELLSAYYYDPINYKIDDMLDYKEKRKKHYVKLIEKGEYDPICISESFFQKRLIDIKKIAKNNKLINDFTMFDEFEDKQKQLNFIDLAENNSDYFSKLINDLKKTSIDNLFQQINIMASKNKNITEFNGQDFLFLVHKIEGLLQSGITRKLMKDMTEWDKHYEKNSFISCSLISGLFISLTGGNKLIIGFDKIKKSDIIAMNTCDIHFLKKHIIGNYTDKVSEYMPVDDFLLNTSKHNEIVINRYRGENAVMPDYLVAFDKIDDLTKQASIDLNIPIYLIQLEKYALKLIDELNNLKVNNIDKYIQNLKRMLDSYYFNCKIITDYYKFIASSDAFVTDNEDANKIIRLFR